MLLIRTVFAVAVVALLGACAGPNWMDAQLKPVRDMTASGSAFDKALHGEYLELADKEYAANDLSDTLYYADKASRAGKGIPVGLEDPLAQGMPDAMATEWAGYHKRLQRAFDNGAKQKMPAVAARAQVAFDCAVREWCEIHDGIKDCKSRFLDALAQLEPKPKPMMEPVARDYIIYFDFDRSNIRSDAARVLDRVADTVRKLGGAVVNLVGHADTVGSARYNQRLSESRAVAPARYLIDRGITSGIRQSGVGETDPRVAPNRDNYREQENRRVEINLR